MRRKAAAAAAQQVARIGPSSHFPFTTATCRNRSNAGWRKCKWRRRVTQGAVVEGAGRPATVCRRPSPESHDPGWSPSMVEASRVCGPVRAEVSRILAAIWTVITTRSDGHPQIAQEIPCGVGAQDARQRRCPAAAGHAAASLARGASAWREFGGCASARRSLAGPDPEDPDRSLLGRGGRRRLACRAQRGTGAERASAIEASVPA